MHRQQKKREEEEEEEQKKANHEVKFNMEVVYHDDESKLSAVSHHEYEFPFLKMSGRGGGRGVF